MGIMTEPITTALIVGCDRLSLYWTKEDGGEFGDDRSGEGAGCGGDR